MTEFQQINACAKRPIDIWTNYLYYFFSLRLVYLIRKTSISPNAVTLFSLFLALLGCVEFAVGARTNVLAGLAFVQVSYVFDCADGQLARYKRQFSPYGGWLDQIADRIKEFAVFFTLAYGYTRIHGTDVRIWMWAMVALFTLYLLEYYGQIRSPLNAVAAAKDATSAPPAEPDTFARLQSWRSLIPFRGFIIGEQYFAMLVFVALGAVYPFFVFVSTVGMLMSVYRPVIQFIKVRRAGA